MSNKYDKFTNRSHITLPPAILMICAAVLVSWGVLSECGNIPKDVVVIDSHVVEKISAELPRQLSLLLCPS